MMLGARTAAWARSGDVNPLTKIYGSPVVCYDAKWNTPDGLDETLRLCEWYDLCAPSRKLKDTGSFGLFDGTKFTAESGALKTYTESRKYVEDLFSVIDGGELTIETSIDNINNSKLQALGLAFLNNQIIIQNPAQNRIRSNLANYQLSTITFSHGTLRFYSHSEMIAETLNCDPPNKDIAAMISFFGTSWWGQSTSGAYYNLVIHDRVLTQTEIEKNNSYYATRFGLT